jgi:hypothetical protein
LLVIIVEPRCEINSNNSADSGFERRHKKTQFVDDRQFERRPLLCEAVSGVRLRLLISSTSAAAGGWLTRRPFWRAASEVEERMGLSLCRWTPGDDVLAGRPVTQRNQFQHHILLLSFRRLEFENCQALGVALIRRSIIQPHGRLISTRPDAPGTEHDPASAAHWQASWS